MKERTYIKNEILLCSLIDGEKSRKKFRIVKKIGDGAMAVAYEAYSDGTSGFGVLHEFYPKDSIILTRRSDNQLVVTDGFDEAINRLERDKEKYVSSYLKLAEVIRNNPDNNLSVHLPVFEIYYGCDEDKNIIGTTYIWTPEQKLETYEKVCQDIHRHPSSSPEFKLVSALKAIESLAEATLDLHMAGFIHRDIKPSNFGFTLSHDTIKTDSFKLFDIDSMCRSIQRRVDYVVVSEGFTEPEMRASIPQRPSVQTDIYSIGATLFYSIIITPETKATDYRYSDDYYDRIDELVASSSLISSSESNSHPKLRHILAKILKKSLAKRSARYEKCEDLIEDIKTAIYYALPGELSSRNKRGVKVIYDDVKSEFDKFSIKNSSMVLINHLYEVPFYRSLDKSMEDINILVVGLGNYGQKFIDICLQAGQMIGKRIRITAVSSDALDSRIYLEERPELENFFNIDGRNPAPDSYGDINFVTYNFDPDNYDANPKAVRKNTESFVTGFKDTFVYAFIALGNDEINSAASRGINKAYDKLGKEITISYVNEKKEDIGLINDRKNIFAVNINAPLKSFRYNDEIERMGFNMHLLWEKNLNVDFREVYKAYNDLYNHTSCVCGVLALKYKLFSIGINLDELSFEEASEKFLSEDVSDELIYLEHRRWVTEKICAGWSKRPVEMAFNGATRDKKLKNHICIVKSDSNQNLKRNFTDKGLRTWDEATDEELNTLDELDRMSVELHRGYVKKAKAIDVSGLLSGHLYTKMYSLIESDKDALAAFQEWFSCVKEICIDLPENAARKIKLYRSLKDAFVMAANNSYVESLVNEFNKAVEPILLSREYRDFKQDDTVMIMNTPFILTFTEKTTLAIPYEFNDKSQVFDNISAPCMVNPNRIVYFVLIEKNEDIPSFRETLNGTISFMKKKNITSSIDLFIAYDKTNGFNLNRAFEKAVIEDGYGLIKSVKRFPYSDIDSVLTEIRKYIDKRKSGRNQLAIEKNNTKLSGLFRDTGIYSSYASYYFDSFNMVFEDLNGADFLKYISKRPHFTISEALSFRRASNIKSNHPEFYNDYKDLWKMYSKHRSSWIELNSILASYSDVNDVIVTFNLDDYSASKADNFAYIVPQYCSRNLVRLLVKLKRAGVISKESSVTGYTSDSCHVNIVGDIKLKAKFDVIFANCYCFAIDNMLNVKKISDSKVSVIYDDLSVRNLDISSCESKIMLILKYLEEKSYINCLNAEDNKKVSFTYSTSVIKRFLKDSDAMLQIYTYHSVKELTSVDDILSSYELKSRSDDPLREIDLVITKGFRMVFVECKSEGVSEEEVLNKLNTLVQSVGTNATAVLITDGKVKKGLKSDTVIISKKDEINSISSTLMKIINSEY